jgi:hypothetical protein
VGSETEARRRDMFEGLSRVLKNSHMALLLQGGQDRRRLAFLDPVAGLKGQPAPAVWALEAQTPAVARAKLVGLSAFYGIGPDADGEYFAVHQHLYVEHSAEL